MQPVTCLLRESILSRSPPPANPDSYQLHTRQMVLHILDVAGHTCRVTIQPGRGARHLYFPRARTTHCLVKKPHFNACGVYDSAAYFSRCRAPSCHDPARKPPHDVRQAIGCVARTGKLLMFAKADDNHHQNSISAGRCLFSKIDNHQQRSVKFAVARPGLPRFSPGDRRNLPTAG